MADQFKPAFRATSGLDAAGEKVVNVAKADFGTLTDGVNVDFFIEENTLQQYDSTRGYRQNFAVIYDNRVWVSNQDIPAPAGAFAELRWKAVRTDPKWVEIKQPVYQLKSGDYVTVNSEQSPCNMSLPSSPQDGDTIVIKDIGNNAGYNEMKVRATNQSIVRFGQQVTETLLTKPLSYNILIFSNRLWNFYQTAQEERGIRVEPLVEFKAQAGDSIFRRYTSANPVTILLPKYANQGDIIKSVDIDGLGPMYHLIIKSSDPTIGIDSPGVLQKEYRTSGDGLLTYVAADRVWKTWDGDIRTRLRIVRDNVKLMPNESITVFGDNNMVSQTINIELPTDVSIGDTIKIALNYLRKQQTVILKTTGGDKIATDIKLLQFPKRSEYPPDATWVTVSQLEFNGDINYTPVIEFSYTEEAGAGVWIVQQNVPTVERVDSKDNNTRKRLGVISLASQTEANVDFENAPIKESAITPETLANRVATESRRGIARIATTAQVNQDTTFAFQDDLIISPKKLNERTATETRRGLAEIATQTETNQGTDDSTIITPLKLTARKASETLTGIAKLVSTVGTVPGVDRPTLGTNVYNSSNNIDIVTPMSLSQLKGTYTEQGLWIGAIESEVIAGVMNNGFPNGVVTPEMLHKKTSTDSRIGLIQIAKQTEVDAGTDYTKAVTPKTLNDRKASETLTGIAEIATQAELDGGTDDVRISTPLKIKTHFADTTRREVTAASGLEVTGTVWDKISFNIKPSAEAQRGTARLATQGEVDTGTDDATIVTPLKLQRKKATEGTEGIIQVATQAEVIAGTNGLKAVPPVHLKYIAQTEKTWEATAARRGFVKLTENTLTFKGDAVNGSGRLLPDGSANLPALDGLMKDGFAVSPYEMNRALQYFLPANAKAVDTDKLDGLDSLQFIRRDVDQSVEGKLTLTKETILTAPLTSSTYASFAGTLSAKDIATEGPIIILNGTNRWNIRALNNGTTLTFGNTANVLTINSATGNVAAQNNLSAGAEVSATTKYNLNSRTVIETTAGTPNATLAVGDNAQNLVLKTLDAGNIVANGGGAYKVLTEKNAKEIVDRDFVKKEGDTMGGKLNINAPVLPKITEAQALAPLNTNNFGFWTADITTPTEYQKLPGYAVPVMEIIDGSSTGHVDHYDYVKAPGIMTGTGTSLTSMTRTWTPRPQSIQDNHNANTIWISVWDLARNKWGEWGRVYTNQAPPTAAEIGAVSSSGSAFNNLTIRDWLQVGQVRIEPDPDTRSVKFTWVDIP
ncbi:long tail fiber, proximal subunit [Edwardsiella phage PEi26]|uniref:Long tail fiber, proximal subunit n=1 Tax=Edwardsiella phage PEi26 TaxID=1608311 RepID=A0A0B6VTX9_9CAUD|nr:long tail fiber, proximal subunit [Edwardsiella phage PEi26]